MRKRDLIGVAGLLAVLAGCATERLPAPALPPGLPVTTAEPAEGTGEGQDPAPALDLEAAMPVALAAPPWSYTLADSTGRRALAVPALVTLSETPNAITDEQAWLDRYRLARPGEPSGDGLADVPFSYRGALLLRVVRQPEATLLIYGEPGAGRYLVGLDASGGFLFAYDFAAYLRAPAGAPAVTKQGLTWAALAGDWLYVQTNHMTYAAESGGRNGYVTALNAGTGALRWRSRPLVANARTFGVVDDGLVTGYGFTAEPDFLYVLDRFTGEVEHETRLKTAPEWIVRQGERLLVRAYDSDYEFALR